jgi:hypothetical protein
LPVIATAWTLRSNCSAYGIRCIFASAYSDAEARQRAEPAAPLGWLQKPYSMTSLTAAVRQATNELHGKTRR